MLCLSGAFALAGFASEGKGRPRDRLVRAVRGVRLQPGLGLRALERAAEIKHPVITQVTDA